MFAAAVPPPPTTLTSHRRRWRKEEREEREPRVWEGKREKYFEKWEKDGSHHPYISPPDPTRSEPDPGPTRAFSPQSPIFFFFYFLHPPFNVCTPSPTFICFFLVLLATCLFICLFTHLYSYYIFFRCILCLVRICIFILLLKHP